MLLAGPGVPENASYHQVVHSIDITPTCFAAGGGTNVNFDGVDLMPFIDGTNTAAPHHAIAVRQGDKFGLRMGDWKLVNTNGSSFFRLYNLSTDIAETTNLAESFPDTLESMKKVYTAIDSQWEKPRHTGITNSSATINQSNRFAAIPPAAASESDGRITVIGGNTLNGNFNSATDNTFSTLEHWTNIGTGSQSAKGSNTNNDLDGTRNAIITENPARAHGMDTGHSLSAAETLHVRYTWRDAADWDQSSSKIRVTLFTTADDTLDGARSDLESFDSRTSQALSEYQDESYRFNPIAAALDGKRLFLEIDAANSGTGFARLDNFVLEYDGDPPVETETKFLWSDVDHWIDDQEETTSLLVTDSFASAELVFPNADHDYTASNNLQRMGALEFMLNSIHFSGNATGSTTVDGLPLILTNNLEGQAPSIHLDQTAGTAHLNNDLLLYNDLEVAGDGTAKFTLQGQIKEYDQPVAITKSGSATLHLTTSPQLTGPFVVTAGTVALGSDSTLHCPVEIAAGGTLTGDGSITNTLSVNGTLSPGASIGSMSIDALTITGTLLSEIEENTTDHISVNQSLEISGAQLVVENVGTSDANGTYIIASYGTLSGTFSQDSQIPDGYAIHYAYDNSNHNRNIALITDIDIDQDLDQLSDLWEFENFGDLSSADATTDADNNGQSDLFEFLTGSNPRQSAEKFTVTQSQTSPSEFTLSFYAIPGRTYTLETSTNLLDWEAQESIGPFSENSPQSISATISEGSDKTFGRIIIQAP